MNTKMFTIAIVGRPNVGKSALFNRICQKRVSIVDEAEGITRDRVYAEVPFFQHTFRLIDTGGIDLSGNIPFAKEVQRQAEIAITEADAILFVVDGQVGPLPFDLELAKRLRKGQKKVIVAVNKIDHEKDASNIVPFAQLGFGDVMGVSALHGYHVAEIIESALHSFLGDVEETPKLSAPPQEQKPSIRVAIVGRANVGKSTLLNKILADNRSIVSDIPGTTRDAIDVQFHKDGQEYLFIDTAGIRRKKSEKEAVDKFASIRTEEALERCDVCLLVLDSCDGLTTQEMRIASAIERLGKSCILLFNKWDLIENVRMETALRAIREKTPFLAHCPAFFISAQSGRNVDKIFASIREVYQQRFVRLTTGTLNHFIGACLQKCHPPIIVGKRLRIYYLTQIEVNPPKFILFVNYPRLLTESYRKFLVHQLRSSFPFTGCPLQFELRGKKTAADQNPPTSTPL